MTRVPPTCRAAVRRIKAVPGAIKAATGEASAKKRRVNLVNMMEMMKAWQTRCEATANKGEDGASVETKKILAEG
jgi:hypothetical protein